MLNQTNIKVASKRLPWIDVTKGLLILLMVMGHIINNAGNQGIDNTYLIKSTSFASLYICFFMQAFIILTGYTSNFEKNFKEFSISLVKAIIIPWVSFSFICQLERIVSGEGGAFLTIGNQKYFFLIEDFWFLHVLFFGKLSYYFLYKYIKIDYLRAAILLIMMVCGFTVFAEHSDMPNIYHYNNFLHWKDLLCMTFFLWFGNYCRRKEVFQFLKGRYFIIILLFYLIGHVMRFFFRMKGLDEFLIAPVIISHGGNAISPLQIPAYLYYVILGSLTCFGIMRYINKCSFLEYFGRNSLVVYCMHFVFLGIAVKAINVVIDPVSILNAFLFIVCSLGLVLLSCTAIIFITKHKPFNYLIGNF